MLSGLLFLGSWASQPSLGLLLVAKSSGVKMESKLYQHLLETELQDIGFAFFPRF